MTTTIAASPRGARIGFSSASIGGTQLLLTVAPKAWRPEHQQKYHVADSPRADGHYLATVFETDRLHIRGNLDLENLAERCLRRSAIESHKFNRTWGEALLHPDVPPSRPDLLDSLPQTDAHPATDLLRLFTRVNLLRRDSDPLSAELSRSPLHRPMLYRRFLDEVQLRLSSTRRGFRPITATHTTIRGRVVPAGLARYHATGDPRIECRYSELSGSTALLGIVCAALDWIADGSSTPSLFSAEYATTRLRHDAVGLRRALNEVTSTPLRAALINGPRLHLTRLDRPWSEALAMSLAILSEREHIVGRTHSRETDAFELSTRTDKLWERIVEELLQRAGFDAVRNQSRLGTDVVADPWFGTADSGPRTFPDLVAYLGNDLVVIDAKYKLRNSRAATPGRDDQYQMFAYSHLVADEERRPGRVMLIYPGTGPKARWHRGPDGAIPLDAYSIPFPQPADVRTDVAFAQYLDCAGMHLANQVREYSKRPE
ncbi:hypothetical protein GSM98_14660 [Rhodococcus rhodochrous]|uniref:5-methylcytosine restriction system specificity protein McrC n=1 Tax=Rhodococcus rhodochrous TaxID=1829 RepID=UPI001326F4F3|nr:hypothetical protein [Rhodococcus rhodochrous]